MAKSKKSKVLASVAAVVLAASMLIGGGTYAYLQGETNDVVNSFNTNEVTVDLTETTGNDYNIIPGTSEDKDPKVTVNATVDAYVFVTVEDATDGLVTYTIADGWTALEGYDNVYYREVSASEAEQEFYVLADNTVIYDAALTNTDMVDADGNLKEGIELTFSAFAIQQDGFANAADAYSQKPVSVTSEADFLKVLEEGGNATVENDITFTTNEVLSGEKDINIDLNGHTIYFDGAGIINVTGGCDLTVENGRLEVLMSSDEGYLFDVYDNSTLTIKDGEYVGGITVAQADENGTVNIYGGSFEVLAGYSGRNWTLNKLDNTNAVINVYGGTFKDYNPANSDTENPADNFVADGYTVETSEDGDSIWYTVVPVTK